MSLELFLAILFVTLFLMMLFQLALDQLSTAMLDKVRFELFKRRDRIRWKLMDKSRSDGERKELVVTEKIVNTAIFLTGRVGFVEYLILAMRADQSSKVRKRNGKKSMGDCSVGELVEYAAICNSTSMFIYAIIPLIPLIYFLNWSSSSAIKSFDYWATRSETEIVTKFPRNYDQSENRVLFR